MKANVIDLSGNIVGQVDLPSVFEEDYRPDLIKRAVLASQANRLQPYGPHFYAGMNTSARSWGPGHGVSRVPRVLNGRRAAGIPMAVGGRRSHVPQPTADRTEKINIKEKRKAIRSAIAATAITELVSARGHTFSCKLPIVVQDALEDLKRTAEVKSFFEAAGLWSDVVRAKLGKNVRAGKGKFRGRRYKHRKSVLIVTGQDRGLGKASRNLSGVDFVTIEGLNAELLAPGTRGGRLTIWTESSLQRLSKISAKELV